MSLKSESEILFLPQTKLENMIHVSKLFEVVQTHKTFSIEWVNERGGIEVVDDASCTSWHSEGNSFNIICNKSGQVRTVNKLTVTKFNGEEVFR